MATSIASGLLVREHGFRTASTGLLCPAAEEHRLDAFANCKNTYKHVMETNRRCTWRTQPRAASFVCAAIGTACRKTRASDSFPNRPDDSLFSQPTRQAYTRVAAQLRLDRLLGSVRAESAPSLQVAANRREFAFAVGLGTSN